MQGNGKRWGQALLNLGIAIALSACEASSGGGKSPLPSVCPSCPQTGGESTDFGANSGTPTPCWWLKTPIEVTDEDASALGFDADALRAAVEREMGGSLTWEWDEADFDGVLVAPPSGYAPTTEVSVLPTIVRLKHVRLDPAICADGTCERDGVSVVEAECAGHLEADVEVALSTADGAMEATLGGYVLQGLPGEAFEEPVGSMWAELAEVSGTLLIEPVTEVAGTHGPLQLATALLRLDLFFVDGQNAPSKGDMFLDIMYRDANDDGAAFQGWVDTAQWTYPTNSSDIETPATGGFEGGEPSEGADG